MGQTLIRVECTDQQLRALKPPVIASGGQNEDVIEFSFCPLWDGFEKFAAFYRNRETVYHVPIIDNQCTIPHEVLIDEGWVSIAVFGTKDDIVRTSEEVSYRIERGAVTSGTSTGEPTPALWERILAEKVSTDQGVENAGKMLGIDAEGNVAPVEAKGGASSWNDLTDKPFYDGVEYGVIISEKELTFADDGSSVFEVDASDLESLTPGVACDIVWNGTKYNCVALDAAEYGIVDGGFIFGNIGALTGGETTNEPFVVLVTFTSGATAYVTCISIDGSATATMELLGERYAVHTIEGKYIPEDSHVYYVDVERSESTDYVLLNGSAKEALEAFNAGKIVYMRLHTTLVATMVTCFSEQAFFMGCVRGVDNDSNITIHLHNYELAKNGTITHFSARFA